MLYSNFWQIPKCYFDEVKSFIPEEDQSSSIAAFFLTKRGNPDHKPMDKEKQQNFSILKTAFGLQKIK